MKPLIVICFVFFGTLLFNNSQCFAQKGNRHHGNGKTVIHSNRHKHNKVVIVKSRYRPAKIGYYHPYWRPKYSYNRRWIYFPRYNFYWDNWRQVYVYQNKTVWVVNTVPPPTIVNVNIESEKHYELKEQEDDLDDVYSTNETHKIEYKPE